MYGFPAITSTIHTVMRDGFQAIGLTVVVGGSGLKGTGDISLPKRVTTGDVDRDALDHWQPAPLDS